MPKYFRRTLGTDGIYWRPNASGYTSHISGAGLYDDDSIEYRPGRGDHSEIVLALPLIEAELAALEALRADANGGE